MNLGLAERVSITISKKDKEIIEKAAHLKSQSVCAYSRMVLLKDAENVIKKAGKSK